MRNKENFIEIYLVVIIVLLAAILLSSCSTRNAKVILADKTEIHYNMGEILRDKQIAEIEIDLKTGTLKVIKFEDVTSPVFEDFLKMIWDAGFLAGAMK